MDKLITFNAYQSDYDQKERTNVPLHKCNETDYLTYFTGNSEKDMDEFRSQTNYCLDDPTKLVFSGSGTEGEGTRLFIDA